MMQQKLQSRAEGVAVGLDIGTTKICAIVGRKEQPGTGVVAVGSSVSAGLRKGIVVDMDLTVRSIRKALDEAEEKAGFRIISVHIGIAGGHIKGFNGYGAIGIRGGEITEGDIDRLVDSAGAVYVPVDREVLHVVPAGYKIDGQNGIKNPVGMRGKRLEAGVHIVTGSVTSVQNLIKCCEAAGVEVADIILEPLASAESVLTKAEKDSGVAIVDIGGGTTDIAIYSGGVLRHTAVLAIGGNHLTNDIAVGLGLPSDKAEEIKKDCGCAIKEMAGEIISKGAAGGYGSEIPVDYLAEIIQARCEELLGLVKKEIDGFLSPSAKTVIVLTGGTSLLRGICELAGNITCFPVRMGVPTGMSKMGFVESPVYATGVGLVRYGLRHCPDHDFESSGIFERMKEWVSGYFNKR